MPALFGLVTLLFSLLWDESTIWAYDQWGYPPSTPYSNYSSTAYTNGTFPYGALNPTPMMSGVNSTLSNGWYDPYGQGRYSPYGTQNYSYGAMGMPPSPYGGTSMGMNTYMPGGFGYGGSMGSTFGGGYGTPGYGGGFSNYGMSAVSNNYYNPPYMTGQNSFVPIGGISTYNMPMMPTFGGGISPAGGAYRAW